MRIKHIKQPDNTFTTVLTPFTVKGEALLKPEWNPLRGWEVIGSSCPDTHWILTGEMVNGKRFERTILGDWSAVIRELNGRWGLRRVYRGIPEGKELVFSR